MSKSAGASCVPVQAWERASDLRLGSTAGLGDKDRVSQERPQKVTEPGVDRVANSHLLRSYSTAYQHDVHAADTGSDQCDQADHEGANQIVARHRNKRALQRIVSVNLEV